jgi:hypothetical protein
MTRIKTKASAGRFVAPKRLTDDEKKALRLLNRIEAEKKIVGDARDRMRVLVEELAGLALESVDDGLEEIESGLDRISEYL